MPSRPTRREVRMLRAAAARRVPWKNGQGFTEEFALGPAEASFERGDFDWRISKARVTESGPFSHFPGFERVLVLTEGPGLLLEHGSDAPRARLRRLEPYRFSGDWPTRGELVQGPVADFNVLARRGRFAAEVLAVPLGARRLREQVAASLVLVHALDARLSVRLSGEEQAFELEAGDSLLAEGLGAEDELDLTGTMPECGLIVVRLRA